MSGKYSRIAIVTGATSGIGEATARKFVASGYGVVGNGRNAEKLRALEQELGAAFIGVAGDASDSAVLDRLFVSASERFGKPADIVVANAGRGLGGSVKDADLSRFEDMLKINVTGTLALLQKAARKMVDEQQSDYPKKAADIVIIGSVVGRHISPFSAVYGATKVCSPFACGRAASRGGAKRHSGVAGRTGHRGQRVSGCAQATRRYGASLRGKVRPVVARRRCGKRDSLHRESTAPCPYQRHHGPSDAAGLSLTRSGNTGRDVRDPFLQLKYMRVRLHE